VGHTLAVVFIAQVHTVGVPVTAPAHGDAQTVHPTLELIHMAAAWRTCGWRENSRTGLIVSQPKRGNKMLAVRNSNTTRVESQPAPNTHTYLAKKEDNKEQAILVIN